MKTTIYITGLMSAYMLIGWITAYSIGRPNHLLFLVAGSIIFFLLYLPLVITKRKRHKEKMEQIIHDYKEKRPDDSESEISRTETTKTTKGWSMNNSPFRKRRSGVEWSGGNIHAANAKRGTRRSKNR
ncbi:MAG: hypothetical protein K9G38_03185 [Bacteroidales bacterium]|nr:hypothetical protein [Bacteroidales bacterium]